MSLSMANDELERVVDFLERMESGEDSHAIKDLSDASVERTAWRNVKDDDDFHEAVTSLSGSTCTMPSEPATLKTTTEGSGTGKKSLQLQAPEAKEAVGHAAASHNDKKKKKPKKALPKVAAAVRAMPQAQPTTKPEDETKAAGKPTSGPHQQQQAAQPNKAGEARPARVAERKPQPKTASGSTEPPAAAKPQEQQQQEEEGKGSQQPQAGVQKKGWFGLF